MRLRKTIHSTTIFNLLPPPKLKYLLSQADVDVLRGIRVMTCTRKCTCAYDLFIYFVQLHVTVALTTIMTSPFSFVSEKILMTCVYIFLFRSQKYSCPPSFWVSCLLFFCEEFFLMITTLVFATCVINCKFQ